METVDFTWLEVKGALTLHTAAEWHRRLVEHFQATSSLHLETSGVTEADTNGVQLLCSAHATAYSQALPFSLSKPSAALLKAFACAGVDPAFPQAK